MHKRCRTYIGQQHGLSLLELIVAMVLSGIVMSGAMSALFVGKSNFIVARELAVLQENARFAMQHLAREIRMAGFNSCRRRPLHYANALNEASMHWYLDNTGIGGFEHAAGTGSYPLTLADDVRANTDVVVVRRADNMGYYVKEHDPETARFTLNRQHDLKRGQVMLVAAANCGQIGLFQVTDANAAGMTIEHNESSSVSPGNCSRVLTGHFDCNTNAPAANEFGDAYPDGSRVMPFGSAAFYIGGSAADSNIPALFQRVMRYTASGLSTSSEELVQGVENMQVLYGVDSSGDDGLVDIYQPANIVDDNDHWSKVISVRLFLRMRSINPVYVKEVDYGEFREITGTGGRDRFMRQVVSSTIQVRN